MPDAPYLVELRGEQRIGCAWYQYTGDQPRFAAALAVGSRHLERVLHDAARAQPIDRARVAVPGYGQGSYLAAVMTLAQHARCRGLIAIACRIKTEIVPEALATARAFPVLAIYGAQDEHVQLAPQRAAVEQLIRHGLAATLHVHPRGHGLTPELVLIIDAFTRRALGVG